MRAFFVSTSLVVVAVIGTAQAETGKSRPAPKASDPLSYHAYLQTSLLRSDMVHPEKFLVEHVGIVDTHTCVVYRSGAARAAVIFSSDSKRKGVAPEICFTPGKDVTHGVKLLLAKEKLPTEYNVSELTARLAYHWADQIRRYQEMDHDDMKDSSAEAVFDELKREMDEHEAFLKSKGDKQMMFMLHMAIYLAGMNRSEFTKALITREKLPPKMLRSDSCIIRIQAAAKAFIVPASLSAECESDDTSGVDAPALSAQ